MCSRGLVLFIHQPGGVYSLSIFSELVHVLVGVNGRRS